MMTAPKRFLRPYAAYNAIQFDGSRASALALDKAFPKRVALSVEHDDVLLAHAVDFTGCLALYEVRPGSWLFREVGEYGAPTLMSDELFTKLHAPQPGTP